MIIFDEPDIAGTILFLIRFLKSPRLAQQLKIQFNGWRSSNANGSTKAAETLSEVSAENANGCNAPAVSCSWGCVHPGKRSKRAKQDGAFEHTAA
jgi:hypothetical protein